MKFRKLAILLITVFLLSSLPVCAEDSENVWKEFYVSASGSDENEGTKEQPFATIKRAQKAVREISDGMQGDIVINIAGGDYFLDSTLYFGPEDSGKNGHQVIYKGEEGNMPVLSAGREIGGFVPSEEYPGLYQTTVGKKDRIMNLYVNGFRRYMAKSTKHVLGLKKPAKYDNEKWYKEHPNDPAEDHYNWHDIDTPYQYDGMYMSKEDIGFYENVKDVSFVWDDSWKTYYCPVEEIMQDPDSRDNVIVRMKPGLWQQLQQGNSSMTNYPRPEKEFLIINAMELLDEPGEFYYNRTTGVLYYMPYEDEDMASAQVIIPELEHIILIDGNGVENKVKNITFTGLQFSHNNWNYMDGLYSVQGSNLMITNGQMASYGYPLSTGNSAVVPAAVIMQMVDNVNFYENNFRGIGGAGIDLPNETLGYKGNSTLAGHLFDFSIGQYDTYTPIQLSQYINTIANGGSRVQPYLLKSVYKPTKEPLTELITKTETVVLNKVNTSEEYMNRVKEGFKAVMEYGGTGSGYVSLEYKPAGKTGTSQSFIDTDGNGVVDKETISNTFAAYAPYDNPVVSFTVVSPDIYHYGNGTSTRSYVNMRIAKEVSKKFFEIYQ